MSAAEVLEQLVLVDEASWPVGLVWRLHANAQLGVVEVRAVQFQEADQHVSEIDVFDGVARLARVRSLVGEVIVVDVTVVVATALIII